MPENTDRTTTNAEAAGAEPAAEAEPAPATLEDVPGWFHEVDQYLFRWFLRRQEEAGMPGDLVELGVYLGKSTILLGEYQRPDDTFTVCDLFGMPAPDDDNDAESAKSYRDLTREKFEANYRAFHDQLPVVVQAPTGDILGHVRPGSCRFVHVDASHLYKHVRADVEAARTMLVEDGIVVFDDYRSPHTPGVSAAVWEAVLMLGLKPIALSPQKFYGTWGDADSARRELVAWTEGRPGFGTEVQEIRGHELARVTYKAPKKPKPAPAAAGQTAAGTSTGAGQTAGQGAAGQGPAGQAGAGSGSAGKAGQGKTGQAGAGKAAAGGQGAGAAKAGQGKAGQGRAPAKPKGPPPSPMKKLARDVLPPIVTRAIRRARKARRVPAEETGRPAPSTQGAPDQVNDATGEPGKPDQNPNA